MGLAVAIAITEDDFVGLRAAELEPKARMLATAKVEKLLHQDQDTANKIGEARTAVPEARQQLEREVAARAADNELIPSVVPPGAFEAVADQIVGPWTKYAKDNYGCSLTQFEQILSARIAALRQILRERRTSEGEPAEMRGARQRIVEAVKALAAAAGDLEGLRRRLAVMAHHGLPESVGDRKALDGMQAKVTAAEAALETARQALREFDPDAGA